MNRGNKFVNILLFFLFIVVAWAVIIGGFGYLYHWTGSVKSTASDSPLSIIDAVYFSLLTFHSIGLVVAVPVDLTGRILVSAQGAVSFLFLGTFIALAVYFFIRRGTGLFLSRYVYVRRLNNRFHLSIRAGNRGPDVLNARASLELIYWREKVRRRITTEAKENAVLENVLSFDVDLSLKKNSRLLRQLKTAVFMNNIITMRFILTGIDAASGYPVSVSRYYTQHSIRFGSRFLDLYQWKNGNMSRIRWRDFDVIKPISSDYQKQFKYYGESSKTVSSG